MLFYYIKKFVNFSIGRSLSLRNISARSGWVLDGLEMWPDWPIRSIFIQFASNTGKLEELVYLLCAWFLAVKLVEAAPLF